MQKALKKSKSKSRASRFQIEFAFLLRHTISNCAQVVTNPHHDALSDALAQLVDRVRPTTHFAYSLDSRLAIAPLRSCRPHRVQLHRRYVSERRERLRKRLGDEDCIASGRKGGGGRGIVLA